MTVYANHPLGGSQFPVSSVEVLVSVGLGVRVIVCVGVSVAVDVIVTLDWVGELVEVGRSMLSRVGKDAIEPI